MTKTYRISETEGDRLKVLLREAEAKVDGLTEEELDEAEVQVSSSLQALLQQNGAVPSFIFDRFQRTPRRLANRRMYQGGLAFLAAAATLFIIQPPKLQIQEDRNMVSKGVGYAELNCEVSWIQSDRSTPQLNNEGALLLNPQLPAYMKIACVLPGASAIGTASPAKLYVNVSIEKAAERVWILQNAPLGADGEWLENKGDLVDFRGALGHEAEIHISAEPLDAPDAGKFLWQDKVMLKGI